jgi:hypothetical protein
VESEKAEEERMPDLLFATEDYNSLSLTKYLVPIKIVGVSN